MKKQFARYASITLASLTMIAGGTGCTNLPKQTRLHNIPLGADQENTYLFDRSVNVLAERLSKLQPGMPEHDVYKTLGVEPSRFRTIDDKDKMKYVDGETTIAQPHTRKDQEEMRERANSFIVREMTFRDERREGGISLFLTSETHTMGFNVRIQLVLKDRHLDKWTLPGIKNIDKHDKETIFETITDAIKGGVKGGATSGIKDNAKKLAF